MSCAVCGCICDFTIIILSLLNIGCVKFTMLSLLHCKMVSSETHVNYVIYNIRCTNDYYLREVFFSLATKHTIYYSHCVIIQFSVIFWLNFHDQALLAVRKYSI